MCVCVCAFAHTQEREKARARAHTRKRDAVRAGACPIQMPSPFPDSRVRRKKMPVLAARLDEEKAAAVVVCQRPLMGRLARSTLRAF